MAFAVASPLVLLTDEEMRRADAAAAERGRSGWSLMTKAGQAIARAVMDGAARQETVVLCGPGNNGGDGYVAAEALRQAGWPVRLLALAPARPASDAARAAAAWGGAVLPASVGSLGTASLAIDALFGAGLTRPIEGTARDLILALNDRGFKVVAADLPSGVSGNSGAVLGVAPRCWQTVTFFRAKPGHYLLPGRELCGALSVADIGIPGDLLEGIAPRQWLNGPALWRENLRQARPGDHKYKRGHALILGGEMTGASRLACRGARRIGVGMATIAAPTSVALVHRLGEPGAIVVELPEPAELGPLAAARKVSAILVGPGAGATAETRVLAQAALATKLPVLLDADALSTFAGQSGALGGMIAGPVLATPHDGEFQRLFPDLATNPSKILRAREAARRLGAVILLKGYDTVVAAPDGRAVINANAPANLATAGAGDVLAGMALGLMAQGLDPFDAACAAAWLHGAAAARRGIGLIAEDLPEALPEVLQDL